MLQVTNAATLLLARIVPNFFLPPADDLPKVRHRKKLPDAGGLKVRHGRLEARGCPPKWQGLRGVRP